MLSKVLLSEISGTVWRVACEKGQEFFPGDELIILESMKMEIPIKLEIRGTIVQVFIEEGDFIEEEQKLLEYIVDD